MSIKQKFVNLQIDYIEVVLMPAASRASSADDNISNNLELQKSLTQTTLGLCIIYHMAFIQAELGDIWSKVKHLDSEHRNEYDIDWSLFNTFKYIRDCFAHDTEGNLFPVEQNNTRRFLENLQRYPDLNIRVTDDKININASTVQQSFNFFEKFICETNT